MIKKPPLSLKKGKRREKKFFSLVNKLYNIKKILQTPLLKELPNKKNEKFSPLFF